MPQIIGTFKTQYGAKYLAQLCKHFAHKVETNVDQNTGWAKLPTGLANMSASEDLFTITLDLRDVGEEKLAKHIIDSHLVTFAYREEFEGMVWGNVTG